MRTEGRAGHAAPGVVRAAYGCAFTRARCMIAIVIHFIEAPMTKGKSGAFRGFQGKPGPASGVPQERKRPAPPPRATVRRKASSKGR